MKTSKPISFPTYIYKELHWKPFNGEYPHKFPKIKELMNWHIYRISLIDDYHHYDVITIEHEKIHKVL